MTDSVKYADVLLPLRLRRELTYALEPGMEGSVAVGCWVQVRAGAHSYQGVVTSVSSTPPQLDPVKIRKIESVLDMHAVSREDISFWKELAAYYMCTPGEVFKAAYPQMLLKQAEVKSRKKGKSAAMETAEMPQLSKVQQKALEEIESHFADGKPVLLEGVTGSGKTEIYMHLAEKAMASGGNVLLMVPEIAMSRQLQDRLEAVFGESLLVFHSKQTAARRKAVHDRLISDAGPCIVLGTRSSILLPLRNISLVVIDEEHDSSYKQDEPAPRYNGRDAAILMASRCKADILLGSATPSYESLYNVETGKYRHVLLKEKFHKGREADVVLIDTSKARRLHNMNGPFSQQMLNEISRTVGKGEQVLVFRSRRAYSTMVQCPSCGTIPVCPNCNIPLTYHKFNNTLECHFCGYNTPLPDKCPKCGQGELELLGAGTEKVEELLREHFPDCRVERFDADTTESSKQEAEILKDFAQGKIDILVGTQMVTKGFDFDKLSLVAVLNADSLLGLQDFRADERALQLLRQFRGRAARRELKGRMLVQTDQSDHPVFTRLLAQSEQQSAELRGAALAERRSFGFPPYVRLIKITVRDASEGRLWHICRDLTEALKACGITDFNGPVTPAHEMQGRQMIREFWLKLPRTKALASTKAKLLSRLDALDGIYKNRFGVIVDVDPS